MFPNKKISILFLIFKSIPQTKKKVKKPQTSFNLNSQKSFLRKTTHNSVKKTLDAEALP